MKARYIACLALAAAAAWAQGPRVPQAGGRAGTRTPGVDMTRQTVVEGVISAVNIAYGAQYPSIEVNKTLIKVAPVWYLLDNDFELKQGDAVKLTAAPAANPADTYLHAVEIVKTASNAKIALRDAEGFPLWAGGNSQGRGPAGGPRAGSCNGGCIEAGSAATAAGTVEQVAMGAGIQHPSLVLKLDDGTLLTVRIGPERTLLGNDFELARGEKAEVKYAQASGCDELVALEITNAAGVRLVLRGENGFPVWN